MKEIQLSQGLVALVDDKDYDELSRHKWSADRHHNTFYPVRIDDTGKVYMHVQIMGTKGIDHKDGNGLNNQRGNLRIANQSQNGGNQRKQRRALYKGISRHRIGVWRAKIGVKGKQIHLGLFPTPEAAAEAYDAAARHHFGEFAKTNFEVYNG